MSGVNSGMIETGKLCIALVELNVSWISAWTYQS